MVLIDEDVRERVLDRRVDEQFGFARPRARPVWTLINQFLSIIFVLHRRIIDPRLHVNSIQSIWNII